MKKGTLLSTLLAMAVLLTGCSQQTGLADTVDTDVFTDRDYRVEYDASGCAFVELDGESARCDSSAVQISGGTVTISDEGTYVLSGTLSDGMIIVDAEKTDKLQLVLDNVDISSASSAAIYIRQADKVFITLAEGSDNRLSNGGEFVEIDENSIDAVIFSKDNLTLNGSGSLSINSPAGHGIVSKDALKLTGGIYEIDAASHGLAGKDGIFIDGAALDIQSGKDGLHSENSDDEALGSIYVASGTLTIASDGDGLSASAQLQIDGGSFSITSGGGSANAVPHASDDRGFMGGPRGMESASTTVENDSVSAKGVKANGAMLINGGDFCIDAADDAVHANGSLTVNGGNFEIATGDDGFHSDELLTINAGTLQISECYEGLEGLSICIAGGDISLTATDDGLNAAGGNDQSGFGGPHGGDMFGASEDCDITISGGNLYLNAGGDGIDSNGSLMVSGGTIVISGPNSGDTSSLDYASSGAITGGTVIATGASAMNMNFDSSSTQGSIMVSTGVQSEGTMVVLTDADGNELLSREADQPFSCVILSCPEIVQGASYTLTIGSEVTEITMDSLIYGSGGFGQFDGRGFQDGMGRSGGFPDRGGMDRPDDMKGDQIGPKF